MKAPIALASVTAALAYGSNAWASVNVHTHLPSANQAYVYSEDALAGSTWAEAQGARQMLFGAYFTYTESPLVELNTERTRRRSTLVESFNTLDLVGAYALSERVQIGVGTSFSMAHLAGQPQSLGAGDSRAFAKLRLNDPKSKVGLALLPELSVPTGNAELFLSDGSVSAGVRLVAERDFGPIVAAANAGYRYSPGAKFRDLDLSSMFPLSVSALVPLGRRWALNGEFAARVNASQGDRQNPTALYAGARFRATSQIIATAGAALGAVDRIASAEFRVVAGVTIGSAFGSEPVSAPLSGLRKEPEGYYRLVIKDEIRFLHAKATLTDQGKRVLDLVAAMLLEKQDHFKRLLVEGHANELGSHPYNQKLSERRAETVRQYLVAKGVRTELLASLGYGKTRPKYAPETPRRVRLTGDRRVEFKLKQ